MKKLLALFVILTVAADAAEYKWIGGENGSWQSDKSFEPNGNPGSEDDVVLPKNVIVKLNAADDEEWEAFNKIRRIRTNDDCCLELDLGEKDREMETAFTYQAHEGRNRGKLIKKGSGALWLMSMRDIYKNDSMYYDYYSNFEIVEGSVGFKQEGITGISVKVGDLAISNNATFFTFPTAGNKLTYTYVMGLCGESSALITNIAPISKSNNNVLRLSSDNRYSFAGKIVAPVRYYSHGSVDLTGTENTITSSFTQFDNKGRGFNGPYVGIASFGSSGKPSSIGLSGLVYSRETGAAFKYLGTGEETDVKLSVGSISRSPYPAFLSGGDNGGLIWSGIWYPYSEDDLLMQRLVIAGNGEKVNVMKGVITNVITAGGVTNSFFIRKQGRGTWRIEDSPAGYNFGSQMLGVWGIDEGTLQFKSIAPKAYVSSLGMATELYKDFCGVKTDNERVPYAFELGCNDSLKEGVLEYVGEDADYCTDRPIWLNGKGAFVNNGANRIRFAGVSSLVDGIAPDSRSVRFRLGGSSVADNEILDITDSALRPINVLKDGSGTWILGGEQSFHGSLDVKSGKLIVSRPEKYTWFKWVLTSKEGTDGSAGDYQITEFALFDKDGYRKNCGLSYNSNYAAVQPGETTYDTEKRSATAADNELHLLFDDAKEYKKTDGTIIGNGCRPKMYKLYSTTVQTPVRNDPSSWIPILMRLPKDTPEIKYYDIVYYQNNTHNRSVTSYFVEGSVDGVHWDRLSTVESLGVINAGYWQYRGTSFGAGGELNKKHENGCAIESGPAKAFDVLNNVKSVSVDRGAELVFDGDITIPALSFDCSAGGGTFTNCKFAEENGFVDIVDADDAGVEIDFGWTFNNCDGVANIAQWGVKVDGVESVRYSLAIKDGNRVVAVRPAMRIIIR